jgi:hypothetical protein
MKNLFNLLERFSRSLNKDTLLKETIAETILERTNIKLNPENLLLKEGVLELNGSPAVNNEIKLKEEGIKEELRERYKINILRILYK